MAVTKDHKDDKAEALAPATDVAASGALIEPGIVAAIDTAHPAVDDNPRAASTPDMNRIDLNTPSALVSEEEQVIEHLKAQD